jgi:hypothetical protein
LTNIRRGLLKVSMTEFSVPADDRTWILRDACSVEHEVNNNINNNIIIINNNHMALVRERTISTDRRLSAK